MIYKHDVELPDDSIRVAKTLGVVVRYGVEEVAAARQACWNGVATPRQQRIVVEILDTRLGVSS